MKILPDFVALGIELGVFARNIVLRNQDQDRLLRGVHKFLLPRSDGLLSFLIKIFEQQFEANIHNNDDHHS